MGATFTLRRAGKEYTDLIAGQLRQLAEKGQINPSDEIKQTGRATWHRAGAIRGLFPDSAPAPVAPPPPPPVTQPKRQLVKAKIRRSKQPAQPVVNVGVDVKRKGSSLGVAAMVLGIVALVACWIPLIGIFTLPISSIGLLLGIVGLIVALTRSGAGIGFPIAGTVLCVAAISGTLLMNFLVFGAAAVATTAVAETLEEASRAMDQLTPEQRRAMGLPPIAQTAAAPARQPGDLSPALEENISHPGFNEPVVVDDLEITILGATIEPYRFKSAFDYNGAVLTSDESWLKLDIQLSNVGQTKLIKYLDWSNDSMYLRAAPKLTDEYDNEYSIRRFGTSYTAVGQLTAQNIAPGETYQSVMFFEKPIPAATTFHLTLNAAYFGSEGEIEFEFPASDLPGE